MKKKNPLGLRVLSTAAVMSIITSIAAPAFAGTYYIGNDTGDLEITANADGSVTVKHGSETFTDQDDEIIIKGGKGTDKASNKDASATDAPAVTTIGETEVTPVEEEPKEDKLVEAVQKETPAEEPAAEEPKEPEAEPEEETKEQPKEPEETAEEEQKEAAGDEQPKETVEETDTEEPADEAAEETEDTEESEDEDAVPAAEDETPVEEDEVPKTTEEAAAAPTKREIAKAPVKPQPEAVTLEAAGEGTAVQDEAETTEEETPTKNVIKVVNNAVDKVLKIILDNVHIDVSGNQVYGRQGKAAMEVKGSGDVTLELNGENVLKSDKNRAGLEKNDQDVNGQKVSGTLTIQDEDQDGGSLEAVGNGNAAGIGSSAVSSSYSPESRANSTSNISITGGTIKAVGGQGGGAGIGSGMNATWKTDVMADNIRITGGNITAESLGNGGAGIGSGRGGNVGTITIGGNAVVTAKGASRIYGGAGIGAGHCETDYNRNIGGDVDTITIEGNATIQEAVGGVGSAGIGAGSNGKIRLITIKDNASVVKAENNGSNGGGGAGIGGGSNWSRDGAGSATIDINTTGTVNATGRGGGAGIGGGGYGSNYKTGGTGTVTISNGTVNAVSEGGGAAIGGGGGKDGGAGIVTISGGTITADAKDSSYQTGAGIGGGYGNVGGAGRVTITGGEITLAKSTGSAGIGDGYSSSPSAVVGENTSGNGFVKITGGTIGKFKEIAKCVWKLVDGTGAIGGRSSAGIGGARVVSDGKAEVTKGHVTISGSPFIGAVGGKNAFGTESAAAIGNGAIGYNSDKSDTMDVTGLDTTKVSVTKPRGEDANETWIVPTHTWDEGKVTKAPTCTEKGEKTFTCTNCSATKTEEIPVDPNAHNYTREEGEKEWDEIIPATCTTAGKKVKHCKNALNDKTHDLVETIAIDKDAHNWGEWTTTKKATCTADGEQERVCKNDTTHKETKKIDATGHQHTKIVGKKDATETEPGYTGDKVCDKCGEIIEKGEVIPAKGHTWVKGEHHDANCMKGGYDDYTCSGCGATKEEPDGTTPNNDHDYSGEEWDEITNATCTTDGKKVKHCKRPGADATHDKTEVIPATGHEKTHIEGKKEPTCEEPGYTGDKVCDKCGDVVEKGEVIPVKGHTPTIVGRVEPTETEPGYTGDTVCADCGKLLAKGEVIPATGKKDAENAEAPELRVVAPGNTLRDLLFTVRQAGTERTYTCKKADATLTGTLETLQYLQANGAETIVFVTNGRVSRFAVADLLALCNEGDVFYLCHTADAEPTLLIIANDHTELLNK